MELHLTLTFACCRCTMPLTVDLKCKAVGGVNLTPGQVASVNVPCPGCPQVNLLIFDTAGAVRGVRPSVAAPPIPEPSVN